MKKRQRIYSIVAVKWDRNPLHELGKIRARELGISVKDAIRLITLQDELSKI